MKITSSEFNNDGMIPSKFTCDGDDINPPLSIDDLPENTKSLALIIEDPDAPRKTWIHWVVYDMPVINQIREDSVPGTEGVNDFGRRAYGGPCPPSGTHHYHFNLFALDSRLNLKQGALKKDVEEAMKGHILAKAELVGLYKKQ